MGGVKYQGIVLQIIIKQPSKSVLSRFLHGKRSGSETDAQGWEQVKKVMLEAGQLGVLPLWTEIGGNRLIVTVGKGGWVVS